MSAANACSLNAWTTSRTYFTPRDCAQGELLTAHYMLVVLKKHYAEMFADRLSSSWEAATAATATPKTDSPA